MDQETETVTKVVQIQAALMTVDQTIQTNSSLFQIANQMNQMTRNGSLYHQAVQMNPETEVMIVENGFSTQNINPTVEAQNPLHTFQ